MADGHIALLFPDIKVCYVCKRGLPRTIEFFPRSNSNKDGFQGRCKNCTASYFRQRRTKMTPEQRRLDDKRRNKKRDEENAAKKALARPPQTDPDTKWCPGCKQYLAKTPEFWSPSKTQSGGLCANCKICNRRKANESRLRNLEAARRRDRENYWKDPEASRARARAWNKTEKGQENQRIGNKKRRERHWLHNRMAIAVRRVIGAGKGSSKWMEYLGYTVEELERHLVRQFTKGMTLEKLRQGRLINIDHIVPLAHFGPVSGPEDPAFQAAWALTNLRPCWAKINQQKGAKRLFLL